jgi:hypothetical protein
MDLVNSSTDTGVFSSELLKIRAGIQIEPLSAMSIRFRPVKIRKTIELRNLILSANKIYLNMYLNSFI